MYQFSRVLANGDVYFSFGVFSTSAHLKFKIREQFRKVFIAFGNARFSSALLSKKNYYYGVGLIVDVKISL